MVGAMARDRQQMRSEIGHWQSETERYKAVVADRHARTRRPRRPAANSAATA
jgi:hypothetical protein